MNLLGPLFPFELARVVRRQRPITGRCLYVGLLLVLLGFTYLSLFPRGPLSFYDFFFRSDADPRQLAMFGFMFFVIFTLVQFAVGTFAMAGSSSSILAEEKEKQTLPFLLTTTLTDREIVFGKVGARLAQILMILLAGLPVLALMQMMGGVDPGLLAAAFIATGVTLISTATIGAAVSVGAASIKQANGQTVGWISAYLIIGPMVGSFLSRKFGGGNLIPFGMATFTVNDFLDWLNAGNFYWAFMRIAEKTAAGGKIDDFLWPMMLRYVIFHAVVATIILIWITRRFRKTLARQSDQAIRKAVKTSSPILVKKGRKPVSQTKPVLWRETNTAIGRANQKWYWLWVRRGIFLLSFTPVTMAIIEASAGFGGRPGGVGRAVFSIIQSMGTMVLCVALMMMTNAAAGSMARDRRQKTSDELFLTDLTNREILNQKMLAAVWPARWPMLWVAIHWVLALITGGLNPISIFIVWPMFALYAFVAVQVGMAFGVRESPRFKPNSAASFALLALAGLPLLLPLIHGVLVTGPQDNVAATGLFAVGMSPPAVMGFSTMGSHYSEFSSREFQKYLAFFAAGVVAGIIECLAIIFYARRKMFQYFAGVRPEGDSITQQQRHLVA